MVTARLATLTIAVIAIVVAGILGSAIAVLLPQLGLRTLVPVVGTVGIVAVIAAVGRPREVLLAGYILSLTYNRQYFSFDDWLGPSGSRGLYWGVSDPLLLALLATSFLHPRQAERPVATGASLGGALLPVLPFLAVCGISTLAAVRPDWAFNDTLRVIKFAILLAWLHRYMTPTLWKTAVFALAAAVMIQSALGVLQVLMNAEASLLAMAGLAKQEMSLASEIENRARGTMGHPNLLAPWLLMLLPAALGAMLFTKKRWVALLGLALTTAGFLCIVASKSRAPAAIAVVALAIMVGLSVRLRTLSPRVAIGSVILLLGIGAAATVPILADVQERVSGDLASSVQFRADYNEAAIAIWNDYPLLGIGPNNVGIELGRHAPWLAKLVKQTDEFRDQGNVRGPTVHNVYFLMLSEIGLLGLFAFLFLLTAVLWRSIRAAALTQGAMRGLCLGVAVGLGASYVQQSVDFSLWYDASWYTFAILAALVGSAPAVAAQQAESTSA